MTANSPATPALALRDAIDKPLAFYCKHISPRLRTVLRLLTSAVIAYAMAYRNVAVAGSPSQLNLNQGKADPSTYSAPVDEAAVKPKTLAAATAKSAPEPTASAPAAIRTSRTPGSKGPRAARRDGSVVNLRLDHLRRMSFEGPVRTVMIGNSGVADVVMISETEAILSPRSVGDTNLIFLGDGGALLGEYELIVREGRNRRVLLQRGPKLAEVYQCAPRCERSLSQLDSPNAYDAHSSVVSKDVTFQAGDGAADEPAAAD